MYTNGFEFFVTVDKFCAGSALGNKILKDLYHEIIDFFNKLKFI